MSGSTNAVSTAGASASITGMSSHGGGANATIGKSPGRTEAISAASVYSSGGSAAVSGTVQGGPSSSAANSKSLKKGIRKKRKIASPDEGESEDPISSKKLKKHKRKKVRKLKGEVGMFCFALGTGFGPRYSVILLTPVY
jgi:hypothetical protein